MDICMRIRIKGHWQERQVPAGELARYNGKEAVAKLSDGVMWCGNEQWAQYYIDQGFVVTNSAEAVTRIDLLQHAHNLFRGSNAVQRPAETQGSPGQVQPQPKRSGKGAQALADRKRKGHTEAQETETGSGGQMLLLRETAD